MKKLLFTLPLLLSACHDTTDIDQVKSLVLAIDESTTLGAALDHRPACQKSSWTQYEGDRGRPTVEYRCQFLDALVQPVAQQWLKAQRSPTNVEYSKEALGTAEKLKQHALDSLLLSQQTFVHLRDTGELQRFRTLVKDSPMEVMSSLDDVKQFFTDFNGERYRHEHALNVPDMIKIITPIYQAFTSAGFSTRDIMLGSCSSPAGIITDVNATMEETAQQYTDCVSEITKIYQPGIDRATKRLADVEASLHSFSRDITLVNFQEVFKWGVTGKDEPALYYHGFEFTFNDGTKKIVASPSRILSRSDLVLAYRGDFYGEYQYQLTILMRKYIK